MEPMVLASTIGAFTLWSIKLWYTNKKPNLVFVGGLLTVTAALIVPQYATLIDYTPDSSRGLNHRYTSSAPILEVAFSPNQGATALILKKIRMAEKSILVAAYSFTYQPIAEALVAAQERGVKVQVVLDRSQATGKYSSFKYLEQHKVPTRINNHYAIMHNKFMIIDNTTLQLGSFNYSKSAEQSNAENVMTIANESKVITAYLLQWQKLWDESI